MDSLTTGATELGIADNRERGIGAGLGLPEASADHLRRLCASLAEATRLLSSTGGAMVDEETSLDRRAHSLDVLAFAMAVDTVLFLDGVREGVRRETREWLGRTLTAVDRLLHFLDTSQEGDPPTKERGGRFCDARENLGKTVRSLRMRLAARGGFRVVVEPAFPWGA